MTQNLQELDLRHLWHPYTNIEAFEKGAYTSFERAEGVYLITREGRRVLDGISSWWAVSLGHSHPKVVEAIRTQAGILQHSILGNLSHPLAVQLAHRLAEIAPGDLNHAYFAADGASAVEAALKIAIQYWANLGQQGRCRFVSLQDGYHGDTLGAVGVGFVPQFHQPFEAAVHKAFIVESPHCRCSPDQERELVHARRAFESLEVTVRENHEELAGVILEPLCQGAAGMRVYPAPYLAWVRTLCDEYDLLLIADEIAVGFGRTGSLFACEQADIVPDILCLGKALTAGYLPMSVAMASDRIYDAFRGQDRDRTFYDGHTFCGNPITSAAALAALDIYSEEGFVAGFQPSNELLKRGMEQIGSYSSVEYFRTLGMIGMCAFTQNSGGAALARQVAQEALQRGLFIRPLGDVLYLWPPLVATAEELGEMIDIFKAAIEHVVETRATRETTNAMNTNHRNLKAAGEAKS